jgi:hypothetical protein
MSEPVFLSVPMLCDDPELNTLGQIIWLLNRRAIIAPELSPQLLSDTERRRITEYLKARFAP